MIQSLKRVLIFLEPKRLKFLVQGFLGVQTEEQFKEKELEYYFVLALFDWLTHLGFVSDSEQERIVSKFHSGLTQFVDQYQKGNLNERHCLTIFDQRYIGYLVCNKNQLYDKDNGSLVTNMEQEPVTIISCDLVSLMTRLKHKMQAEKTNGQRNGSL